MAEILRLGSVLMVVALVAAAALGLANWVTAPVIEVQEREARLAAMNDVSMVLAPGDSLQFDSLTVEGLPNPYALVDEQLRVVGVSSPGLGELGYLFTAYGKGYSSTIQTLVCVDLTGSVTGSVILYQQETPGLGANVEKPDKLIGHFVGRRAVQILLAKDGGDIDAITASTITSRAVVNSVREGIEAMDDAGLFADGSGEGGAQ
jgi:electron transport complex protein RnfG